MAALTQHRCLAGTKAFTGLQKHSQPKIANGAKYFMRKNGSYMVEVNVAETETEDQAVRRYMRAVVQSGVLNKLRARRTKETKIETYKRKLQERAQARKLGIEEPTWEEFYGESVMQVKPFDDFFSRQTGDDDDSFLMPVGMNGELPVLDETYYNGNLYELDAYSMDNNAQSGYLNQADQGGYINQDYQQGGYIQPQQQQQEVITYNFGGQQSEQQSQQWQQ